jgi:hypothetical protein
MPTCSSSKKCSASFARPSITCSAAKLRASAREAS